MTLKEIAKEARKHNIYDLIDEIRKPDLLYEFNIIANLQSANSMYPVNKYGRKILSNKGRALKVDIKKQLPATWETIDYPVAIKYNFSFNTAHQRDIVNYEKAITDSIVEQGIIKDDSIFFIPDAWMVGDIDKKLQEHQVKVRIYRLPDYMKVKVEPIKNKTDMVIKNKEMHIYNSIARCDEVINSKIKTIGCFRVKGDKAYKMAGTYYKCVSKRQFNKLTENDKKDYKIIDHN